jgi:hypothetical protein
MGVQHLLAAPLHLTLLPVGHVGAPRKRGFEGIDYIECRATFVTETADGDPLRRAAQKGDTELGHLRLNVEEVARNKTMKDVWPLQSANKGDIELTLSFQPIIFEEDEAVRARYRPISCCPESSWTSSFEWVAHEHLPSWLLLSCLVSRRNAMSQLWVIPVSH